MKMKRLGLTAFTFFTTVIGCTSSQVQDENHFNQIELSKECETIGSMAEIASISRRLGDSQSKAYNRIVENLTNNNYDITLNANMQSSIQYASHLAYSQNKLSPRTVRYLAMGLCFSAEIATSNNFRSIEKLAYHCESNKETQSFKQCFENGLTNIIVASQQHVVNHH
ncbi:MAG: hypothetical protein AAGB12_08915 [Pseudomonadota bacterium]